MKKQQAFYPQDTVDNQPTIPQSQEAEYSVLGGLMLDNSRFDLIADKVSADDFYNPNHRMIFMAMTELAKQQTPFDVITLSESLKNRLNFANGLSSMAYLGVMARDTPTAANVEFYADIVHSKAQMRNLLACSSQIAQLAFDQSPDALEKAEQMILAIADKKAQAAFLPMKNVLGLVVDAMQDAIDRGSKLVGLSTGFKELDAATSGLKKGNLVVIGARPSMGKSALAFKLALNIAKLEKVPGAIFSMEMSATEVGFRMTGIESSINLLTLSKGLLSREEMARSNAAMLLIKDLDVSIDDTAALSIQDLKARVRRLHREKGGLGFVVIDYLGMMGSKIAFESEALRIAEITNGLKSLAKELGMPVILLAQLNRELEKRPNKRPIMSDLRASGSIEQDADLILFIYRDEVYNENTMDKGIAEIIIAKQRNGPTGTIRLRFEAEYARFSDFNQGSGDD